MYLVTTFLLLPSQNPWFYLVLFLVASLVMIWRLESMIHHGVGGTVLGTVVMPYCSGLGNLIFAFLIGSSGTPGGEVLKNCVVNNITNLTILIGIPAIIWGSSFKSENNSKAKGRYSNNSGERTTRLSILFTLIAVLFFTGVLMALASDRKIDSHDAIVLIALFLFWQILHVFEVLKDKPKNEIRFSRILIFDLVLLGIAALGVYLSIEWLVGWLSQVKIGFLNFKNIGWLSGWLMILPNALLAVYYGWTQRPEIVYTSQIGDAHICIPLCVGIVALYKPIEIPTVMGTGLALLLAVTAFHIVLVTIFQKLPRWAACILVVSYGFFVYRGIFS